MRKSPDLSNIDGAFLILEVPYSPLTCIQSSYILPSLDTFGAFHSSGNTMKEWKNLNYPQVGKYAGQLVKTALISNGLDVCDAAEESSEVDFAIRNGQSTCLDIQVKSIRGRNYLFFPKSRFTIRENLFLAIVVFLEENPDIYLIPSTDWLKPDNLLIERKYEDLQNAAEWGINISRKNWPLLERYRIEKMIVAMK